MKKFPEIEQFYHVVKRVQYYCNKYGKQLPTLEFEGTVKLHGTNVGVRRVNGKFVPQSRNRILSVDSDNYDFAKTISGMPEEDLNNFFDQFGSRDDDITLYGELIGKGIQNKVAVSELSKKQWVLFDVVVNGERAILPHYAMPFYRIYSIKQIPSYNLIVDFNDAEKASVRLEEITREVEDKCPWGAKFGVDGIGEGIVWKWKAHPEDSSMWFKTKGQKHTNDKKKKIAPVDPVKMKSVQNFTEFVLTNERLMQGWNYVRLISPKQEEFLSHKDIGAFIKWVSQDILKEEVDILNESGLSWKDVNRNVTRCSKEWFLNRLNAQG